MLSITWFLSGSAKRKQIFNEVSSSSDNEDILQTIQQDAEDAKDMPLWEQKISEGSNRTSVLKFNPTRWSMKVDTLSSVLAKYEYIMEAMDIIGLRSSGDAKKDAALYYRMLEDPKFIVSLFVAQYILSCIDPLTKILQGTTCSLDEAYEEMKRARQNIADQRTKAQWESMWKKIEAIGKKIDVEMKTPRCVGRQRYRENAVITTDDIPKLYYRQNVNFPFIDHVLTELNERFADFNLHVIAAQLLRPRNVSNLSAENVTTKKFWIKVKAVVCMWG